MRQRASRMFLLTSCLAGLGLSTQARTQPSDPIVPGEATPAFVLSFAPISSRTGNGGPSTAILVTFTHVGQTGSAFVWSGGPDFRTLCAPGSGLEAPSQAVVVWRADATLRSFDASGATIDVHWSRAVEDRDAVNDGSLDRHVSMHLVEGQRDVLDLVRMAPGADPSCDGAAIMVNFALQDSRALVNSLLEYDIWLIDRDRTGYETIDHVTTRGLQGRSIDYAFTPIKYAADGTVSRDGTVQVDLRGQVKGRVRRDGRIDLVVGASRMRTEGRLGTGDGGGTMATVGQGETVEFQLPVLQQSTTVSNHPVSADGELTAIRVTTRRIS